ncbi:MAG TPA: hypothetical protein VLE47_00450 [Candidatus Saccharimonadales bacterium]|nr:hypothetical protein [Candidatus Saccharimonadales bacterium]
MHWFLTKTVKALVLAILTAVSCGLLVSLFILLTSTESWNQMKTLVVVVSFFLFVGIFTVLMIDLSENPTAELYEPVKPIKKKADADVLIEDVLDFLNENNPTLKKK